MGECKKTTRGGGRNAGRQEEEHKQRGEQAAIRWGGLDYKLSFITQPPTRLQTVEGEGRRRSRPRT